MTEYHFSTPRPLELYVEIGRGSVTVTAADVTDSLVEVTGPRADQADVEHSGDRISIVAPKQRAGFLSGDASLDVVATIPATSDVAIRTGSADIVVSGPIGTGHVRSGSGSIRLESVGRASTVDAGTGDVRVEKSLDDLRIKSGTGDVCVDHVASALAVSTGSGDVQLGTTEGSTVVKTGSGDLQVQAVGADLSFATGSGDAVIHRTSRGRVSVTGASSDVQVGVRAGIPVWTDLLTVTGTIHSNLTGAGEPQPGSDHVELRAKTVSGDIILTEV